MIDRFLLMMIASQPDIARFAVDSGVDRIFVDLEQIGKQERQGHLDTVMSVHTLEDVASVRAVVPSGALLVRINPLHTRSADEIDAAIEAGADLLMLPMYRDVATVRNCLEMIDGRCPLVPLAETADAVGCFGDVVALPSIREIYIGLNDLQIDLSGQFMFEPLASGMLDDLASIAIQGGVEFGFGGIARIGEGLLPAELILAEHARLGSTRVILSRTFHRRAETLEALREQVDLSREVNALREKWRELLDREPESVAHDRRQVLEKLKSIVGALPQEAGRA